MMEIQKENQLLKQFEKTITFKRFFSTLLRFDEDLDCFIATEKWRDKEAELLSAAWWMFAEVAKAQVAPEGFVLVPKAGAQYFSHDFIGDGFKYHDTLDEAKKEAEASLDWYRDQVADGMHVNDMGEFNELSYGLVVGSAEYSIDHVVTQGDIDKGESKYEVGTEILSLYLSETQEQSHE